MSTERYPAPPDGRRPETRRHNGFGVDLSGGPANLDMAMIALNLYPRLLDAAKRLVEAKAAGEHEAAFYAFEHLQDLIAEAEGVEPEGDVGFDQDPGQAPRAIAGADRQRRRAEEPG